MYQYNGIIDVIYFPQNQYAIQQQQQLTHQQNLLYASMRHASGGPHAQAFVTPLDYAAAQLPLLVPNAAVFAHASSPQALMYPQSINGVRKSEGVESTLRSPLLDEFRANKSRKWELKVCKKNTCCSALQLSITFLSSTGYIWLCCRI